MTKKTESTLKKSVLNSKVLAAKTLFSLKMTAVIAVLTLAFMAALAAAGPQAALAAGDVKILVEYKTADVDNAGTNEKIYINIYDETGLIVDYETLDWEKPDRDDLDSTPFWVDKVGTIEKIELKVGGYNNWCVSWLEVNGIHFEARDTWVSNDWTELYPLEGRVYEITTDTADEFEGGTSGEVFVKFIGDSGETRWMILDKNNYTDQVKGHSDSYSLRDIDVGTVRQIVLQTDSSDEWCIARVHFQGVTYHCHGKGIENGESFTIYVDYNGSTDVDAASVFSQISTGTWFAIIGGGVVFAAGIIFAVVRRKKQSA